MKRFVLIDHSVCDLAGHHYEYAMHVLRAAQASGYEPVLVTNRKFREPGAAPWPVMPLYEFGFWPEPALSWYAALAAKLGPPLKKFWCVARCRFRYSGIGLAWNCRFEWKRYLHLRPASPLLLPSWFLGIGVILAAKLSRLICLTALLPLALLSAVLWLLLRVLRGGARLGVRAAYSTASKAGLPAPLTRYFGLLGEEIVALALFTFSALGTAFRRASTPRGATKQENRQAKAFARDTARMLEALRPQPGDLFFFPTISPRDLLALTKPLTQNREAARASWHFLFRRNIFEGDAGQYARQDAQLNPLRAMFHEFRRTIGGTRVYFYTDTDELTEQHERLGVFPFHTLPIPHTHSVEDRVEHSGPLRLTYLGDARGEKGFHLLPRLAKDLMRDVLAPEKARFVIQCNYNIPGGEPRAAVARAKLEAMPRYAELFRTPLTSAQYRELLLSADINLLMYDPVNYYARSSGILVESLAAGIPVIVPAGCWLSRQFLERHRAHVSDLPSGMHVLAAHSQDSIPWAQHGASGIKPDCSQHLQATDESRIYSWFFVPAGATHLLIAADFENGVQGQVVVSELDWHDQSVRDARTYLLEPSGNNGSAAVLAPLCDDLYRIWLAVGARREGNPIVLRNIRIEFLKPKTGEPPPPLGAVGAIYHNESEITELVRDLVLHYPHYRRTASEFASGWRGWHNAERMVEEMNALAGPAALEAPKSASGVGRK